MNVNKRNVLYYCLCLFFWLAFYCSGIVVGTASYRSQLNQENMNVLWLGWCWLIVFSCYSLSNIAVLCCLASVIGGFTRDREKSDVLDLLSKGLFVYLMILSGTLVLDTSPFAAIDQAQYLRLATMASLFSFVIGYYPEAFQAILAKASQRVLDNPQDKKPGGS